jgi:hypothetical protein
MKNLPKKNPIWKLLKDLKVLIIIKKLLSIWEIKINIKKKSKLIILKEINFARILNSIFCMIPKWKV